MQLEISAWASGIAGGKVFNLSTRNKPDSLMDGDIIIMNPHHIGWVCADGTIVQSQDTHIGVTQSSPGEFDLNAPGEWTHLLRLDSLGPDWEWPYGWWRVYDGNTYYYFIAPHGVAHYTKTVPFNTHVEPVKSQIYNSGRWTRTWPDKLAITWNKRPTAPAPCTETFYNAIVDCTQMRATSSLYGDLVAYRLP